MVSGMDFDLDDPDEEKILNHKYSIFRNKRICVCPEDVILTAWLKLHRANLVTECDEEVHYACEHKAKGSIPVITTQWVLDCVKQEQILDI